MDLLVSAVADNWLTFFLMVICLALVFFSKFYYKENNTQTQGEVEPLPINWKKAGLISLGIGFLLFLIHRYNPSLLAALVQGVWFLAQVVFLLAVVGYVVYKASAYWPSSVTEKKILQVFGVVLFLSLTVQTLDKWDRQPISTNNLAGVLRSSDKGVIERINDDPYHAIFEAHAKFKGQFDHLSYEFDRYECTSLSFNRGVSCVFVGTYRHLSEQELTRLRMPLRN